jgi:PHP family Zn ribbon phosphoesterase
MPIVFRIVCLKCKTIRDSREWDDIKNSESKCIGCGGNLTKIAEIAAAIVRNATANPNSL